MKVEKKIHKGYAEMQNVKAKEMGLRQLFGKYQYIYSSKKGEISLVLLKAYHLFDKSDVWEIYELSDNKLFEDTERFKTQKEAEIRIKELLN